MYYGVCVKPAILENRLCLNCILIHEKADLYITVTLQLSQICQILPKIALTLSIGQNLIVCTITDDLSNITEAAEEIGFKLMLKDQAVLGSDIDSAYDLVVKDIDQFNRVRSLYRNQKF